MGIKTVFAFNNSYPSVAFAQKSLLDRIYKLGDIYATKAITIVQLNCS